ncbi:DUF2877 domain-containing protein [Ktedonosporobacter rubrisoli]|nr:DUF2877 domain-containing protein [Ktedonosporobacter rubrisoli]
MATSLVALDYSRPVQAFFEQEPQFGSIHSVFSRAVNLSLNKTLIAVLSSELQQMPNGLRLSTYEAKQLFARLRPGESIILGKGALSIPAYELLLVLPTRPAWEPRPAIETCNWSRDTVRQHVRSLVSYLAERVFQEGLLSSVLSMFSGRVRPRSSLAQLAFFLLHELMQACWQQDSVLLTEAVQGLAGLGPGLTPSGDDLLGGFAAVMALLSQELSRDSCSRASLAETIATTAQGRTTSLSCTLLTHAARGEVAEHVGTLLLALSEPITNFSRVLQTAQRLQAFGATSGSDTLAGVLLGLRTLEGGDNDFYREGCP